MKLLLAVVGVMLCMPLAVRADEATEAQEAFDSLFAADIKKAATSPDAKDDIELAARLMEAAKKAESQPALAKLCCEKAYELAAKSPQGYDTAIEAMELLVAKFPDKKEPYQQKIVDIYLKQYGSAKASQAAKAAEMLRGIFGEMSDDKARAGDFAAAGALLRKAQYYTTDQGQKNHLQARINFLGAREKVVAQIAGLKGRLATSPQDAATNLELVRLYVMELDNPAEAAKYLALAGDETLRTYVPLANTENDKIAEGALLELADWYRGMSEKAGLSGKGAMLRRAKMYYELYLEKHTAEDLSRTKSQLAVKKINEALATVNDAIASGAGGGESFVDLLAVADIRKQTVGGTWELKDGKLSCQGGKVAKFRLPASPQGSYEVKLKLTRTDGNEAVALYCPVGGGNGVAITLCSGSNQHVLERVAKGEGEKGSTTVFRPGELKNGKEYLLTVVVIQHGDTFEITADLDGKRILGYKGKNDSVSSFWAPENTSYLGIGAWKTDATWSSVKLRMLSGNLKKDEPAAKEPPAKEPPPKDAPPAKEPPAKGTNGDGNTGG